MKLASVLYCRNLNKKSEIWHIEKEPIVTSFFCFLIKPKLKGMFKEMFLYHSPVQRGRLIERSEYQDSVDANNHKVQQETEKCLATTDDVETSLWCRKTTMG